MAIHTNGSVRELILGVAVVVIAAAFLKYADLPTRVSVVETQMTDVKADQNDIKQAVHEILRRMPR